MLHVATRYKTFFAISGGFFTMASIRVLFILKFRQDYLEYGGTFSSGLYNSAVMNARMLAQNGDTPHVVEIVDNNSIDCEVASFLPDVVIIEGLWVVPEKFDVLRRLHPHVRWIVRLHSEMPFLAQEGVAIDWVTVYAYRGVEVAFNSTRACTAVRDAIPTLWWDKILYLPNYYPERNQSVAPTSAGIVRVGCFGALRSGKNLLNQALAAIRYADQEGQILFFHINQAFHGGCEGPNVLKNLKALFASTHHVLVIHPWYAHKDFLKLVGTMDVGLQVSFSESFNIVSADFASQGVPLVVSSEIRWASYWAKVNPNDIDSIVSGIFRALGRFGGFIAWRNRKQLVAFSKMAQTVWKATLG